MTSLIKTKVYSMRISTFAFLISILTTLPAIAIGLSVVIITCKGCGAEGGEFQYRSLEEIIRDFTGAVIFAPVSETLVNHFLVILALKKIISSRVMIILITASLFSAGHLYFNSIQNMLATLPLSFALAFTFIFWLDKTNSKRSAFIATCAAHALHNFYYFLMSFIPASVFFG